MKDRGNIYEHKRQISIKTAICVVAVINDVRVAPFHGRWAKDNNSQHEIMILNNWSFKWCLFLDRK